MTTPDPLRAALETIRAHYGHVCPDFDICVHPSCRSSYSAWQVADAALAAQPAPPLDALLNEARHQAVRDAIRRLPNVLAVYETTNAAALAHLIADGAPLSHAIIEDVWDGVRKNWPLLSEPKS